MPFIVRKNGRTVLELKFSPYVFGVAMGVAACGRMGIAAGIAAIEVAVTIAVALYEKRKSGLAKA